MVWMLLVAGLMSGQDVPPDVKVAQAKLERKPDDGKSLSIMGRWEARKGNWEGAVPLLASGLDRDLKSAAELESKEGVDPIKVGHAWLKASMRAHPYYRTAIKGRAYHWYGLAWDALPDEGRQKLRPTMMVVAGLRPGAESAKLAVWKPDWWMGFHPNDIMRVDTTFAMEGGNSIRLIPTGLEDKSEYSSAITERVAPPDEGETLVMSCYAYSLGTDRDGTFRIRFFREDGSLAGQTDANIPPDRPVWNLVRLAVKVPRLSHRFDVLLQNRSPLGATWVDCVSVKDDAGKEYISNGSVERR